MLIASWPPLLTSAPITTATIVKIALNIPPSIIAARKRLPLAAGIRYEICGELFVLLVFVFGAVAAGLEMTGGVAEKLRFPHSGQIRIVGINDLPQFVQK